MTATVTGTAQCQKAASELSHGRHSGDKLAGVNVEATAALAKACGVKVIASGGVSSLGDIIALKAHAQDGVEGCIIGKAIYTGAIDLKEALAVAKEE